MVIIDDYRIVYYKNENLIEIGLPQTMETATNTVENVSRRKVHITNDELRAILVLVMEMLERKDE